MKRNESGFTLIELVVVIVILGILAATALPKFIDMKSDAAIAARDGVAGGLTSAFATNYASFGGFSTSKGAVRIGGASYSCDAAAGSVLVGGVPTGYTITGSIAQTACTSGGSATCGVSNSATTGTSVATLICTG